MSLEELVTAVVVVAGDSARYGDDLHSSDAKHPSGLKRHKLRGPNHKIVLMVLSLSLPCLYALQSKPKMIYKKLAIKR